jgi:hypothetical protein
MPALCLALPCLRPRPVLCVITIPYYPHLPISLCSIDDIDDNAVCMFASPGLPASRSLRLLVFVFSA